MFRVSSYRRQNGDCPYEEYVESLFRTGRKKDAAKIDVYVQELRERGSYELTKLGWSEKWNDIWELRPGRHRVLYFWDYRRRVYILLNGFLKSTRKTPNSELQRAEGLMTEYFVRQKGG